MAYLGKLLAELHLPQKSALKTCSENELKNCIKKRFLCELGFTRNKRTTPKISRNGNIAQGVGIVAEK